MTVVVPVWIARRDHVELAVGPSLAQLITQAAGVGALLIGLTLFVSSLRRFAGEGKGTLAPWDPPRTLVISGPYRYVRNPMFSGVVFVLFGEALVLLSRAHLSWALVFLVVNLIYIPLLEEPQLQRRFGESYAEYCRHVRRLLPRSKPWTSGAATLLIAAQLFGACRENGLTEFSRDPLRSMDCPSDASAGPMVGGKLLDPTKSSYRTIIIDGHVAVWNYNVTKNPTRTPVYNGPPLYQRDVANVRVISGKDAERKYGTCPGVMLDIWETKDGGWRPFGAPIPQ